MNANLSAQKQGGDVSQDSRHILEALFESVPEAVVISDENGCIVRVNVQVEKLFGYSRDGVPSIPLPGTDGGCLTESSHGPRAKTRNTDGGRIDFVRPGHRLAATQ